MDTLSLSERIAFHTSRRSVFEDKSSSSTAQRLDIIIPPSPPRATLYYIQFFIYIRFFIKSQKKIGKTTKTIQSRDQRERESNKCFRLPIFCNSQPADNHNTNKGPITQDLASTEDEKQTHPENRKQTQKSVEVKVTLSLFKILAHRQQSTHEYRV